MNLHNTLLFSATRPVVRLALLLATLWPTMDMCARQTTTQARTQNLPADATWQCVKQNGKEVCGFRSGGQLKRQTLYQGKGWVSENGGHATRELSVIPKNKPHLKNSILPTKSLGAFVRNNRTSLKRAQQYAKEHTTQAIQATLKRLRAAHKSFTKNEQVIAQKIKTYFIDYLLKNRGVPKGVTKEINAIGQ